MLLYKFKPATNLLRLLDIVVHDRLYCSSYSRLNDPFEGQFKTIVNLARRPVPVVSTLLNLNQPNLLAGNAIMPPPPSPLATKPVPSFPWTVATPEKVPPSLMPSNFRLPRPPPLTTVKYSRVDDLPDVGDKRVCSLSRGHNDVRMWSLYADSHTGVAVEIDFHGIEDKVHEVKYVESLPKFGESLLTSPSPVQVLTCKTHHWRYEEEYRIIGDEETFNIDGRIRKIILGIRCDPAVAHLLQKVVPDDVEISRAELDMEGVSVRCGEVLRPAVYPDPEDPYD